MSRPVRHLLAAGTVCFRIVDGVTMVLLVHRTKQRDVSFPKGKLDFGESMPQAAVRETLEETGLRVGLGVNLGTINYQLPQGSNKQAATKTVQYWAAEVSERAIQRSTFRPNREISALEWVPITQVSQRLSYQADRELFAVFERLHERRAVQSFSILLLRHAKAEPRGAAYQEDHLRPLADIGENQAETLVPILAAFAPGRLYSSDAIRCMSTVAPLASHLKKRIRDSAALSQQNWDDGDLSGLRAMMGKVVRRGKNALLCSHRPVLPDLVREIMLATGSLPGEYLEQAATLPPGAFSVFHISKEFPGSGLLGVETYPIKL